MAVIPTQPTWLSTSRVNRELQRATEATARQSHRERERGEEETEAEAEGERLFTSLGRIDQALMVSGLPILFGAIKAKQWSLLESMALSIYCNIHLVKTIISLGFSLNLS